jgi:ribonuclease P protein component
MATFKKTERLHKKKEVAFLFEKGKGIHADTLKLIYAVYTDSTEYEKAKGLFVAPKRLFKKSPDRNTLKRRMREAFRLLKEGFKLSIQLKENESILIGFIYKSKESKSYQILEAEMRFLLQKVSAKINPS